MGSTLENLEEPMQAIARAARIDQFIIDMQERLIRQLLTVLARSEKEIRRLKAQQVPAERESDVVKDARRRSASRRKDDRRVSPIRPPRRPGRHVSRPNKGD